MFIVIISPNKLQNNTSLTDNNTTAIAAEVKPTLLIIIMMPCLIDAAKGLSHSLHPRTERKFPEAEEAVVVIRDKHTYNPPAVCARACVTALGRTQ